MHQGKKYYGIERHYHDETPFFHENWYSEEWFETAEERDKVLAQREAGASDEPEAKNPNVNIRYRKIKIVSEN